MIVTHQRGEHKCTPPNLKPFVRRVEGDARFINESVYFLIPMSEQGDWNKLTGIAFNPLKPNDHAIMIGWRYNVDLDVFELCPYFNVNGAIHNPETGGFVNPSSIAKVKRNEMFSFKINYDFVEITTVNFGTGQVNVIKQSVPPNLKTRFITSFRINSWFGGTLPAPTTIKYILNV